MNSPSNTYKILLPKYYLGMVFFERAINDAKLEFDDKLFASKYLAYMIDGLFALELFLKLVIDYRNNKIDSVQGHSIKDIWGQIPEFDKNEIINNLTEDVDFSKLPGDSYTSTRYWWSTIKDGNTRSNYGCITLLKATRQHFEYIYGTIPAESSIIKLYQLRGGKWEKTRQ
jgi:hypothetical protein